MAVDDVKDIGLKRLLGKILNRLHPEQMFKVVQLSTTFTAPASGTADTSFSAYTAAYPATDWRAIALSGWDIDGTGISYARIYAVNLANGGTSSATVHYQVGNTNTTAYSWTLRPFVTYAKIK